MLPVKIFSLNLGQFELKFAENCPIFAKVVHFFAFKFSLFVGARGGGVRIYVAPPPVYVGG